MRNRLVVLLILGVGLVFGLLFARQLWLGRDLPREQFTDKKLRVLTYSTFMGSTGPGRDIVAQFKKAHGCDVEVTTSGDAGLLLERLRMAQASVPFDVVIGLDQFMLEDARAKSQWLDVPLARDGWNKEAILVDDSKFTPFDWSPMAFVYRKSELKPPTNFDGLLEPTLAGKIALQDPRASSPGMLFFKWVEALKGSASAEFLQRLKPNVQSVSPTWAFAYGLFNKHQVQLVFSYVTSLAYHWGVDKDRDYQIVIFPEGHPLQVEYAAVPADCRECDLARAFVGRLLEPDSQKSIMQKNFMFPVLQASEQGSIYSELPKVKPLPIPNATGRDLSDWDKVFKN